MRNRVRIRSITGLALIFLSLARSQPALRFDVVSIRLNNGESSDSNVDSTAGGLLRVTNESVRELIKLAYGVKDYQITGAPAWLDSEHYDIVAKTDSPQSLSFEEEKSRIRTLLVDRFGMKSHLETREGIVYRLSISKSGLKMTRHDDGTGTTARATCGHLLGKRVTAAVVATMFSRQLEHDVIDDTGLPGKYDVEMNWTPDSGPCPAISDSQPPAADRPSFFTAVQQQLGLKLDSTKGPVEILVIDRIGKPSEN